MSMHVAAGEEDIVFEIAVQITHGYKLIWDASAGLDYVLIFYAQDSAGIAQGENLCLKIAAANKAANQRHQALNAIVVNVSDGQRGNVAQVGQHRTLEVTVTEAEIKRDEISGHNSNVLMAVGI